MREARNFCFGCWGGVIPYKIDGLRVPARFVARAMIDQFPNDTLRVTEIGSSRPATTDGYSAVMTDGGVFHYFHLMEAVIWLWAVQHAFLGGVLTLINAEVEDSQQRSPIAPKGIGWDELNSGANAFNLISIKAQVVSESREQNQDKYLLTADGNLFSAVYRHTDENLGFVLPPMKHIPAGATVRVTGVTSSSYGSNPFEGPTDSDVLLRSFDDIEVIAQPSWLNVRNLTWLVGTLLVVILMIGIRVVRTERKARLYNATMARLERQRGRSWKTLAPPSRWLRF